MTLVIHKISEEKLEDKWAVATEPQHNLILITSIHPSMCIADRLASRLRIGQFQPSTNQVVAARDMVVKFGGYKHWLWTQTSLWSLGYLVWHLRKKHKGRLRTRPPGGLFQWSNERGSQHQGTSTMGFIINLDLQSSGLKPPLTIFYSYFNAVEK